jgi:competence protein ComEC
MALYPGWIRCTFALLAVSCLVACHKSSTPAARQRSVLNSVEWIAIDVNSTEGQADANLVRFARDKNYLIDAGDANGKLVSELRKQNVDTIEAVIISHAHRDHYSGIRALLNSSIQLRRVFINIPARQVCDSEKPWGCDYAEVEELVRLLRERGVEVRSVKPGDVMFREGKISLEVLYAYDGVNTPVGKTDVNDMSLVMLLSNDDMRVLFTGDLNRNIGTYLAGTGDARLKAQFLKMPHHGASSLAPDSFFDWVDPRVVVVPAPAQLWRGERCKQARDWVERKRLALYVTGLSGNFAVSLEPGHYNIATP